MAEKLAKSVRNMKNHWEEPQMLPLNSTDFDEIKHVVSDYSVD